MSQQAAVQTVKKPDFNLPEDTDASLSILMHASALNLEEHLTHLVYWKEIANQQIKGLSRLPRDVEKSSNQFLDVNIRLAGDISQLDVVRRQLRPPNWLLAMIVLFGTFSVLGFLYTSPQYRPFLDEWWGIYGGFAMVVGFLFAVVLLAVLWRRRRRKG